MARKKTAHMFSYRCPFWLLKPLDEARFTFREPSRTSLVTKAIVEYLTKRHIDVPSPERERETVRV